MTPIADAIKILNAGGLVAFPTETVYGLGADATNPSAVRRIFQVKGRPPTNPLICHVADSIVARRYARTWPEAASRLCDAFWPGPLTIVLAKTQDIVAQATASLDTVGLRAPDHPLTLELLQEFDKPLAGPSANRSTHVSPTTAQHVRDDLGDAVDLILDGGPCSIGIESTVIDLTPEVPTILRPGGISREKIQAIIGDVAITSAALDVHASAASPGQQARHYAPRTPAFRLDRSLIAGLMARQSQPAGVLFLPPIPLELLWAPDHWRVIEMPDTPEEYAQRLYATLRALDEAQLQSIYIETPPDRPEWLAVRDRIQRATRPLSDD